MGGRRHERGPGKCAACEQFHAGTCRTKAAEDVEVLLKKLLPDPNDHVSVLIAIMLDYAERTADPDEAIRKIHGYVDEIWEEHAEARAQRLAQRGIQRRALSS